MPVAPWRSRRGRHRRFHRQAWRCHVGWLRSRRQVHWYALSPQAVAAMLTVPVAVIGFYDPNESSRPSRMAARSEDRHFRRGPHCPVLAPERFRAQRAVEGRVALAATFVATTDTCIEMN